MIRNIVLLLSFFTIGCCFSQDTSNLIDAFEDYSDLSREQIYIHLNKSTYITGEMLAFNAYVFLKDIKEPSTQTANVYCQILDSEDNVLAEKMIMMNQGFSRGDFMIDSTYVSGEYKFKSYTNWNKNFANEQNYFLENFRVINPNEKSEDKPVSTSKTVDIQVLPESGHLLAETLNVVGVIAKNELGLGIPNLKVDIVNRKGDTLTSTNLNALGIGKFQLYPTSGEQYQLQYSYANTPASVEIPDAKDIGIILSLKDNNSKSNITLALKTNAKGFDLFGDKAYQLIIHNGTSASQAEILFNGQKESLVTIDRDYLYKGLNILTLFDENNKPIAERLLFNFNGLPTRSISKTESRPLGKDSLDVKLSVAAVDSKLLQNLSISILPSETKSYEHHQNIISSIYLQPYLRSAVEHASYYFTNTDDKKKAELDDLLLTQGWSSYDWTTIFNAPPEPIYDFEIGVDYTINVNSNTSKNLLIYPNVNTKSELLTLDKNQSTFQKRGFFPLTDEKLRIGEFKSNGKLRGSDVVLQFSPSKILGFDTSYHPKTVLKGNQYAAIGVSAFKDDAIETLDEVQLYAKKEYTKMEKLKNASFGKITEFGEEERRFYKTFAQFITGRGFEVDETQYVNEDTQESSRFRIETRNPVSINATKIPIIYLDDAFLVDFDILYQFSMEQVDYVIVNKSGIGEGVRGGAGVIRIYTDPFKKFQQPKKISFTEYTIPLTYSTPKRFYIPEYSSYNSNFFKEFGVIDWMPNAKFDANGNLSFKVFDTNTNITLFIEGVVNGNQLISQEITINN